MPLDLVGNISLALSVTCLFLLVLGLPLVRGVNTKKNLIRHGYLTIVALVLQTILVLVVMVPAFFSEFDGVLALSPMYALDTWLHVGLGVVSEVIGFWFVGLWLIFSVSRMRCATAKKYMTPTLIFWLVTIITGTLIHLLQMLAD
jgi:hypothetical protein